jgi:hypothetical protein
MLRSGSVHFIWPANMRPSVVCRCRVRLRKVERYWVAAGELDGVDVVEEAILIGVVVFGVDDVDSKLR